MSDTVTDQQNATSDEREQRRQMALRHVRQYPDPVLRRQARPVEQFDDELQALVEYLEGLK